jgi:hypothetical protein
MLLCRLLRYGETARRASTTAQAAMAALRRGHRSTPHATPLMGAMTPSMRQASTQAQSESIFSNLLHDGYSGPSKFISLSELNLSFTTTLQSFSTIPLELQLMNP